MRTWSLLVLRQFPHLAVSALHVLAAAASAAFRSRATIGTLRREWCYFFGIRNTRTPARRMMLVAGWRDPKAWRLLREQPPGGGLPRESHPPGHPQLHSNGFVPYNGDTERPCAAAGLRDHYPTLSEGPL